MERFSDEAQRNGDKQLEMENRRLRKQLESAWKAAHALLLLFLIVCGMLILTIMDLPAACVVDESSQLRAVNHLRLDAEAKLHECTDARFALQLGCDVLVEAANQCTCAPPPRTLPSIDVVGYRHNRKVYP